MNNSERQLFYMGKVGRPRGIKGEITALWLGMTPPAPETQIFLGNLPANSSPWQLTSSRFYNGKLVMTLAGVSDRSAAEKLNGLKIYLQREALPPLEENEVYFQDVHNADVFLENGDFIGKIDHFESIPGQELWVIHQDGKPDVLFPVRKEFITSINLSQHKIIISPPPGLLEVYRA